MKIGTTSIIATLILLSINGYAQLLTHKNIFTRQDTLRGSISKERAWWDLQHYNLKVEIKPDQKFIQGSNVMKYKVIGEQDRLQIDLQPPMVLLRAVQNDHELKIEHDGNAHFIHLDIEQEIGKEYELIIDFEGKPVVAKRPPWDGGFTWTKDNNGLPFIANANQGIGASVWWPNKDHAYDEPDNGVLISVEVPENLMNVSNGRLINTEHNKKKKTKTYHWKVVNPINNYGVNINIGDYVHFGEKYQGEKGELDMDYYVLRDNLDKAKVHFKDASLTLEALEYWFGPYPFYEDSYKLVEAPYLGMEHQSSVTYGNGYVKGYRGQDLSGSGWGLKWDYIIVHESGHEWFANNITHKDPADMWIHEGFTAYSENLFLDYHYGKKASSEYVMGTRFGIENRETIIGKYNVNKEGSGDMYSKGANMLHSIRQIINNDEKWRSITRGLNQDFYHQVVTTKQVEDYISKKSGIDLSKVFDQYLRDIRIPTFEYAIGGGRLFCRWGNAVDGFNMPLKIVAGEQEIWVAPATEWKSIELPDGITEITVDPNFYVGSMNVIGK